MPVFSTADGVFSLDGKPMTILSGAIHYFRTHPDQWRDRLEIRTSRRSRISAR